MLSKTPEGIILRLCNREKIKIGPEKTSLPHRACRKTERKALIVLLLFSLDKLFPWHQRVMALSDAASQRGHLGLNTQFLMRIPWGACVGLTDRLAAHAVLASSLVVS